MASSRAEREEAGFSILIGQSQDRKKTIPYNPIYMELTGNSVAGAILLQQITFRWFTSGRRPFYKFAAPCEDDLYRENDSWQEELGFTRSIFETARKSIHAKKISRGMSKREAEKRYPIIYWTDSNRLTWYQVNEPVMSELIYFLYFDKEGLEAKLKEIDGDENECGENTLLDDDALQQSLESEEKPQSLESGDSQHSLSSQIPSQISSQITSEAFGKTQAANAATTPSLSDEPPVKPTPGSLKKEPTRSPPRAPSKGQVEKKSLPLADHIRRNGVHAFKEEGEPDIAHIYPERTDLRITCPFCETEQDWPPAEGRRAKRDALTCWECGALFVVHGYKVRGQDRKYTYTHPDVRKGVKWRIEIEGVPSKVRRPVCTEKEMHLFIRNWDEDPRLMRSKLEWASRQTWLKKDSEVVVTRVNAAFESTRKAQIAEEAIHVVPEPLQDPRVGPDEIWFGPPEKPPEQEYDPEEDCIPFP